MEKKMEKRAPILVITNDKWSQDTYVVFDDDEIIDNLIPADWIDAKLEETDFAGDRDEIAQSMYDDFFNENDTVDNFWPEKQICQSGISFYQYDADGRATYLGDYESIDEIDDN
jgi:hypothetical protein